MSLDFLVTSLIVVVTPGTGVLYTLAAAISGGRRASVVAAFGCTLGIVPHIIAAIAGLAAVLNASAEAFQVLKYLGVAYLLYLAWSTWRQHGGYQMDRDSSPRSFARIILDAVLVNLLNPKLSIFFLAFLPQFVSAAETDPLLRMLLLSAVFMLLTFVVFVAYGLLAAAAREQLLSRERLAQWMRRAFAGTFVALAARLAIADR